MSAIRTRKYRRLAPENIQLPTANRYLYEKHTSHFIARTFRASLGVGQSIEAIAPSLSGCDFIPQSITTFDVPPDALNLYSILQLEVDIGVQALERESADVAVTFFQSHFKHNMQRMITRFR